jgi:hypothetical protein
MGAKFEYSTDAMLPRLLKKQLAQTFKSGQNTDLLPFQRVRKEALVEVT